MKLFATASNAASAHNFSLLILSKTCVFNSGSWSTNAWASNTAASSADKFLEAASLIASNCLAVSAIQSSNFLISAATSSTVFCVTVKSGITSLYALAIAIPLEAPIPLIIVLNTSIFTFQF